MQRKIQQVFGWGVLFFVILIAAHAAIHQQPLHPVVKLISIKPLETQESRGDEIYLMMTSFYSHNKSTNQRIPGEPLSWPSRLLDKVQDVKVWENDLLEGEAVTVIVNVIEQDVPPWNTDDLIGIIRLHLKNEKGKLIADWVGLNNLIPGHPNQRMFILNGEEGGRYQVVLELTPQHSNGKPISKIARRSQKEQITSH